MQHARGLAQAGVKGVGKARRQLPRRHLVAAVEAGAVHPRHLPGGSAEINRS